MMDAAPAPATKATTTNGVDQPAAAATSDYYFDSYSHFGIHEEMLKDSVRTIAYRRAILENKHLFKDKVVLDVGCGTGILSMFAVQAGARLVIGVDMSGMIHRAKEIVDANGFVDKIVLLHGKMEEVQLPVDKVDVIISEWMGYCLLYESMFDTVMYARDRYLAEGGVMMPDRATMYLSGIEDEEYRSQKIDFWENVYGFDMRAIQPYVMREPLVDVVDSKLVVTDTCSLKTFDLLKVTKDELAFRVPFELVAQRQDFVHAFVAWFDVEFAACLKPVFLPTGPYDEYTHWKQTVFYFNGSLAMREGERITGEFALKPNAKNPRELDISLAYDLQGEVCQQSETREYHMC